MKEICPFWHFIENRVSWKETGSLENFIRGGVSGRVYAAAQENSKTCSASESHCYESLTTQLHKIVTEVNVYIKTALAVKNVCSAPFLLQQ